MHVLGAIEGDPERFRALRRPMDRMVDAQIEAKAAELHPRLHGRRLRKSPYERLPTGIRERYEDLVLVCADANAWPYGAPEREFGDELVSWAACRPSTGESISLLIAPRKPVAPDVPCYTGIPLERLRAGGTVEAFLRDFGVFARPTDVIASWGFHAMRLFKDTGGAFPWGYLDLRSAARAVANGKVGTLERYAAGQGVETARAASESRAERRVEVMSALLANWRALAPSRGVSSL